jgi:hypothetical protein
LTSFIFGRKPENTARAICCYESQNKRPLGGNHASNGCALGHLKVAIIDEQTFISCGYYKKIDLLMALSCALSLLYGWESGN